MKRILAIGCALVALVPLAVSAADATAMKYVPILPANVKATTTEYTDVSAYKGNASFAFFVGASTGANYSVTLTLKHATTTNGTYVTVTNIDGVAVAATFTGVKAEGAWSNVACDLSRLRQYVKVSASQLLETNTVGALLVAPMKSE